MPTVSFVTLQTELSARLQDPSNVDYALADVKRWINGAVRHYWDIGGYAEVTDQATLVVVADVVEYTLPAAITRADQVISISVEEDTGEPYTAVTTARLIENAGTLPTTAPTVKMLLDSALSQTAGRKIRIVYKAPYGALSADGDLTEVPAEFIYTYAQYLAHTEKATNTNDAGNKAHQALADRALRDLNALGFTMRRHPQQEGLRAVW